MRWRRLASVAALLLLPVVTLASTRYDPRLRFRTISTPRFDIHYHQGEEAEAKRLAAIAESVATELDATLGPAAGRVQVILVAQSDLSNGWATPLPYNTIEITAAAPAADSIIGNASDWLRLVFTHEYTHIVHLGRGRGWIGGLRRAFGRMPVLFPNLYLPVWQVEGIATHQESASTGQGRVRDSSVRAILDVAAGTRFETLDRVGGGLVDWPGGNTPYVYGGFFHAYLARKYGEDTLRRLTDATAGRIPFLGSPAFKQVVGRDLGTLWQDFKAESTTPVRAMRASAVRRTHHGFEVSSPRFGPDGRLYYAAVNPHGFPALMALDPKGATPVKIRDRFLGRSFAFAGTRIVFDQIEFDNHVGLRSDLYIADLAGGPVRRLTHGQRAGAPDVSPDGARIVCTIQEADRRSLAVLPLNPDGSVGALEIVVSEPGVQFDYPRWSPTNTTEIIAQRGRDIVQIHYPERHVWRVISAANGARLVHPFWRDGTAMVLFASDQGGKGFQVHQLEMDTSAVWVFDGTGPDARFPIESPDRDSLWFVGYSDDGYDIYSLLAQDVDSLSVFGDTGKWRSLTAERAFRWTTPPKTPPGGTTVPAADGASRYSPWPTLAPRYWTPLVSSDGDELVVGAATGSADALGRHGYAAQAAWTATRGRPDWQAAYVYDRWWPTIFASVSDDTDPWRDAEIRTREGNAGMLLPFRRIRRSQSMLAALHTSTDELICGPCVPETVTRRAARAGWRVSSARGYGYSISLEDGWSATTTAEFTREAWGSTGDGGAVTFDVRGYLPVRPRHAVVAVRGAAATTWGSTRRQAHLQRLGIRGSTRRVSVELRRDRSHPRRRRR